MSWKIYHAWRVPITRINEALDALRKDLQRLFYERIYRLFADELTEEQSNPWLRTFKVDQILRELTEKNHPMGCGVTVRFDDEGFAYFEPYGPMGIPRVVEVPDWLEDFRYWNNTEPPKEIPKEEWETRGDKWKELCEYCNPVQQASRLLIFEVYGWDNIPSHIVFQRMYCEEKYGQDMPPVEDLIIEEEPVYDPPMSNPNMPGSNDDPDEEDIET